MIETIIPRERHSIMTDKRLFQEFSKFTGGVMVRVLVVNHGFEP